MCVCVYVILIYPEHTLFDSRSFEWKKENRREYRQFYCATNSTSVRASSGAQKNRQTLCADGGVSSDAIISSRTCTPHVFAGSFPRKISHALHCLSSFCFDLDSGSTGLSIYER